MSDPFEIPEQPAKERPEPKRDRWGRYLLTDPATGKEQPWTRATTFAKSISDTFALSQWGQRMTAKGFAMRPDLVALAATLDPKKDRKALNDVVEQAKDTAGQKSAANLGTALHSFSEYADEGNTEEIPDTYRSRINEYSRTLENGGLQVVPAMIERITVVPQFSVAGTFDRILETEEGDLVIGDLKTGRDLTYGWNEIAIQLALYAHGVNQAGVWDAEDGSWEPVEQVREDYGVVIHMPAEGEGCTLYKLNLEAGWQAAELCAEVRAWRSQRKLAEPYTVAQKSWESRFSSASSRSELSSLYTEAYKQLASEELERLVMIGRKRLEEIQEEGS